MPLDSALAMPLSGRLVTIAVGALERFPKAVTKKCNIGYFLVMDAVWAKKEETVRSSDWFLGQAGGPAGYGMYIKLGEKLRVVTQRRRDAVRNSNGLQLEITFIPKLSGISRELMPKAHENANDFSSLHGRDMRCVTNNGSSMIGKTYALKAQVPSFGWPEKMSRIDGDIGINNFPDISFEGRQQHTEG